MARLFAIIAAVGGFFWAYELWKGQNMTEQDHREKAVDTLARTLWGEARDQGDVGMEAVASVVMNRVKFAMARGGYWWGNTVTEVCLKDWQFSCWNANDPNRVKLELVDSSDPYFAAALQIARRAVSGQLADQVNGATHYHNPSIVGLPSAWGDSPRHVASMGDHEFYSGIA